MVAALCLMGPVAVLVAVLVAARAVGVAASVLPLVVPLAVLGMGVGLWWWFVHRRGWGGRELGFTRPVRSLWHLLWEVPLAVTTSAGAAAVVGPTFGLTPTQTEERGGQSSLAGLVDRPVLLVLGALALVVLGPLLEELIFRRVLLDWLRAHVPTLAAVLLSGVVFGLAHMVPVAICYVLPLGLWLGLLRVWHGSLWASLLAHVANNALVTGVTLGVLVS